MMTRVVLTLWKNLRRTKSIINENELVKSSVNFCANRNYSVLVDSSLGKPTPAIRFEFSFEDDRISDSVGNNVFWRRKMRTIHNLLDVNKDGIISFDDFKLLADRFVRLGNLRHEQRIEFCEVIQRMWKEQWGCIDPYNFITTEQFLEDMQHVINDKDRRKRVHRLLPYLFMAVDKNHDGAISFPEYLLFFKCLGLSYEDAIASFESIDLDKNGVLTIEEFVKLGREYFLTYNENEPSNLFWGPLTS